MATIVSHPAALCFSGNIPDAVIASSSAEVTVEILKGAEVIASEIYNPVDGQFIIRLRDLVTKMLEVHLPPIEYYNPASFSAFEQEDAAATITVNITDSGTVSFSFKAIKGGIDPSINTVDFVAQNFLSWQPQVKKIHYWDPNYLSFYAQQNLDIFAKGYFASGSPQVIRLGSLDADKLYTWSMLYPFMLPLFAEPIAAFDVWMEYQGTRVSNIQRFVYTIEYDDYPDTFLWENSLGGIDTVRFTGIKTESNNLSYALALINKESFPYDINFEKSFAKTTGEIDNDAERQWILDFFYSLQQYHFVNPAFNPIVVSKPKLDSVNLEMNAYEFSFAYAIPNQYFNLPRLSDLPDIVIDAPPEETDFEITTGDGTPITDSSENIITT